jgi:hypothetical protein
MKNATKFRQTLAIVGIVSLMTLLSFLIYFSFYDYVGNYFYSGTVLIFILIIYRRHKYHLTKKEKWTLFLPFIILPIGWLSLLLASWVFMYVTLPLIAAIWVFFLVGLKRHYDLTAAERGFLWFIFLISMSRLLLASWGLLRLASGSL